MLYICIYIYYFAFFFRGSLFFSRQAREEREKWKKKRKRYPVWTRHRSRGKLFLTLSSSPLPGDVSETTFLHSNTPHVVCGSVPTPLPLNHVVPRLAIRNQSFVTNKDKCYKRPQLPLANRPLPSPPVIHLHDYVASTPLTKSHGRPPTTAQCRCADIKRQIKIRCYLSKLWTGSNSIYINMNTYTTLLLPLLMLHYIYTAGKW